MQDIHFIRNYPEIFEQAMFNRNVKDVPISKILQLDQEKRQLTTHLQNLQKQRNDITKKIELLKKSKNDAQNEMDLSKEITTKIEQINIDLNSKSLILASILETLPNIPENIVPIGKDENDNLEIKKIGSIRNFSFTPKPHYELGENLQLINFKQAAKISGPRFAILTHHIAKLDRALANFMLDLHTQEFGYTEVFHPSLVKESAMYNVGQLPKFSEDSFLTTDSLRLIPTSEVVLTNLVADTTLHESALPLRFTAYSQCFRSEAGSAGRDTRGIIRQHQFSKVELVSVTTTDNSSEELERMLSIAEEVLKRLELPYRVVRLCTGDMSFSSQHTYDIEVWFPSQNTYREISSCSNCGAFQARRMNAKYISQNNTKEYVNTLNGSALAIGRTIAAIMENYQNADGSISVPHVLQKYMNNLTIISKN